MEFPPEYCDAFSTNIAATPIACSNGAMSIQSSESVLVKSEMNSAQEINTSIFNDVITTSNVHDVKDTPLDSISQSRDYLLPNGGNYNRSTPLSYINNSVVNNVSSSITFDGVPPIQHVGIASSHTGITSYSSELHVKNENFCQPEYVKDEMVSSFPTEEIPVLPHTCHLMKTEALNKSTSQNNVESEQLVYTTLNSIKREPEIMKSVNEIQPVEQQPAMYSSPNIMPVPQTASNQQYSCYSDMFSPWCASAIQRQNMVQNMSNENTGYQAKWNQGKQVMMNQPMPNMPVLYNMLSEPECEDRNMGSLSSFSNSTANSFSNSTANSFSNSPASVPCSDMPNVSAANSNDWNLAGSAPMMLTPNNETLNRYPDVHGNYPYYGNLLNDRESHNQKERVRRARVTKVCSLMRMAVPGLSETTDKARVFAAAVHYLKFLLNRVPSHYTQDFVEYMKRKGLVSESDRLPHNNNM